MKSTFENEEFSYLIKEIISDKDFIKAGEEIHHGSTRFEHSLRVAYYTYITTKKLNLKYEEATRAALLHDFFDSSDKDINNRFTSFYKHPKVASKNSSNKYDLSERQLDIIEKHMFPITLKIPRYKESWIVSFVDKGVAMFEMIPHINSKLMLGINVNMIFLSVFVQPNLKYILKILQ